MGTFDISIIKVKTDKYMLLQIDNYEQWCEYHKKALYLSCILDEIKPLFDIEKRGMNIITIGRKTYTIMRSFYDTFNERPIRGYKITNLFRNKTGSSPLIQYPVLQEQVCKILIFRDICCCSSTDLNYIHVIRKNDIDDETDENLLAISGPELGIKNGGADDCITASLSVTTRNKFFQNDSIYAHLRTQLNIDNSNEIYLNLALDDLKKKITYQIKTVSEEYLWLTDLIFARLVKHLS